MKNVSMEVDGNILTLVVDLSQEFGPSKTGRTTIVASTEGNQKPAGWPDISVGLNVYKKR